MKKIIYSLVLLMHLLIPLYSGAQTIIFVDPCNNEEMGTFSGTFTANIQCQYRNSSCGAYLNFTLTEACNIYLEFERTPILSVYPHIGGKEEKTTTDKYYIFTFTGVKAGDYDLFFYGPARGENLNIVMKGTKIDDVENPGNLPAPLPEPTPVTDPASIQLSSNRNYVAVFTPAIGISSLAYSNGKISNYAAGNVQAEISYFDGLGRMVQQNQYRTSPTRKDIVTMLEYDELNVVARSWLPGAFTSNGAFADKALIENRAKIQNVDHFPYSEIIYERSLQKRPLNKWEPGIAWRQQEKKGINQYLLNVAKSGTTIADTDVQVCAKYTTSDDTKTVSIARSSNYGAGELFVTRMSDENGNIAYQFNNKLGQTVLQRQINDNTLTDTYFVYDSYGNLRAVLPPMAASTLTSGTWTDTNATMQQYAYLYKYDDRNRCIAKKLPGADWIYYVYDKTNRLIFTQDGEQRKSSEWAFTIPDALGRPVVSGVCKNSFTYTANPLGSAVVKATFSPATNTYKGYTISGVTLTTPTVLSVNYYDGYTFMNYNGIPASTDTNFKVESISGYGTQYTGGYSGLLTGTLTARLTGKTVDGFLHKVFYYDQFKRPIQIKANNHLTGGIDKEYLAYNFIGQQVARKVVHTANGATQTEEYKYTYDHAGRLTKATHQLGTAAVTTLVDNTYDEQGRLATSRKGGHDNLKTTLTYNVRSWPTRIAGYHFWENLTYGWNGNITKQEWGQAGKTRSYTFAYDNLSRLKTATYTGDGAFGSSYTYDKNGNIKTLTRSGQTAATTYGVIDNLTLEYTGNQLKYVTDSGPNVTYNGSQDFKDYTKGTSAEYTFDQNGRMTKDLNKGMGVIQYNWLNLPSQVDLKNQAAEMRKTYTYAADGTRLSVETKWNPSPSASASSGAALTASALTATKKTDYVAGKVYENGTLKKILIDGGYYDMTDKKYYFFVTDHLGSTRIVGNTAGSVIQHNQNDPFGVQFAERTTTEQDLQPYKYTAQELDRDQGLNLYNYHARQYDPAIGRFTTMDPLAEKYYSISPYAYCLNNPTRYIDINGKSPGDVVVAFAGAKLHSADGLGATPQIIQMIQPTLNQYGGVGQAFSSQLWGTNVSKPGNAPSFDTATQEAYDYILENYNMYNGEQVEGGRIFIHGYSYGGVMANHLAKRLQEVGLDVELLITVDAAAGRYSKNIDRTVPSNVKTNINYYQTVESKIDSRGGINTASENSMTKIYNHDITQYGSHSQLNELTKAQSATWIINYLQRNWNDLEDGYYNFNF